MRHLKWVKSEEDAISDLTKMLIFVTKSEPSLYIVLYFFDVSETGVFVYKICSGCILLVHVFGQLPHGFGWFINRSIIVSM